MPMGRFWQRLLTHETTRAAAASAVGGSILAGASAKVIVHSLDSQQKMQKESAPVIIAASACGAGAGVTAALIGRGLFAVSTAALLSARQLAQHIRRFK